jgi:hypothetical protein
MLVQTFPFNDTLWNMHYQSGGGSAYAKGILVGIVGALMSVGMEFDRALALCSKSAPKHVYPDCCPESWLDAFGLPEANRTGNKFWTRTEGRV